MARPGYALAHPGIGQQLLGWQLAGLQFGCCEHCCLFFLSFLGLFVFAKVPVASVHTIASNMIFFILMFDEMNE